MVTLFDFPAKALARSRPPVVLPVVHLARRAPQPFEGRLPARLGLLVQVEPVRQMAGGLEHVPRRTPFLRHKVILRHAEGSPAAGKILEEAVLDRPLQLLLGQPLPETHGRV